MTVPGTDRRFLRMAQGVAHDSLRGQVEAEDFVHGDWQLVAAPLVDLCASPDGVRDRQLPLGTRFCAVTATGGWVFGFSADDGYCGWLPAVSLDPDHPVTHWVAALSTHAYPAPDIKTRELSALPMQARVQVIGQGGTFAETPKGFVHAAHLRPLGDWCDDPVSVARLFLGTPYLWGGNGPAGIDCSGLVQAARRACGLACPADSDLQRALPGAELAEGDEAPGDLICWAGHVAMVSAPGRIIHANAHHMAVVEEGLADAVARIATTGAPVLRRFRPAP